jgi:hypothetical protein
MLRALTCLLMVTFAGHAGAAQSTFDHQSTGFELTGAHREVPCESCHVRGVFRGTPRTCAACHSTGTAVAASPKPATHMLASDRCENCHSTMGYRPAMKIDHADVLGSCNACHNNVRATGKPTDHPVTSSDCSTCHRSSAWMPARFDHALVTGSCVSCHNNTTATGKDNGHIASDDNCDACHVTTAWKPVIRVDHAHVQGSCNGCHNGVKATGKPLAHVTTTKECSDCHSTLAWKPASFSHDGVTGNCSSCHNGSNASGPSPGHMTFPVNGFDCSKCHAVSGWRPNSFMHAAGGGYPGDHRAALDCTSCHSANTDAATWRSPAYKPDCAGCHSNRYKADSHTKYGNVKYTVAELRNCSGACHVYTDSTLTTISKRRNGPQHRITSSKFGD